MVIDVHCHYTFSALPAADSDRFSFEPLEQDGRRALDSYTSPRANRKFAWRVMKWLMGIDVRTLAGPELDRKLAAFYESQLGSLRLEGGAVVLSTGVTGLSAGHGDVHCQ